MLALPIGLRHSVSLYVDDALTVPRLPSALRVMADMPPVFATAYMVAFIEAACIEALAPYLEPGEATVGTRVDVSHMAATPIGLPVTAQVKLLAAEARKLRFSVQCHDGADVIGEGQHVRFVVNRQRFLARAVEKAQVEASERLHLLRQSQRRLTA